MFLLFKINHVLSVDKIIVITLVRKMMKNLIAKKVAKLSSINNCYRTKMPGD